MSALTGGVATRRNSDSGVWHGALMADKRGKGLRSHDDDYN
jgi:hypothetical protein